jgi:hypothetical protein
MLKKLGDMTAYILCVGLGWLIVDLFGPWAIVVSLAVFIGVGVLLEWRK